MTAKEKAKQLYDRFEKIFIDANADSWGEEAKKCALIAVNEIVNELIPSDFKYQQLYTDIRTYWEQVKEEINRL